MSTIIPDNEYLSGLAAATAHLNRIIQEVQAKTGLTVAQIVADIRQRSAERAPKQTGTLRRTAYDEVTNEGSEIVGAVIFPEQYAAKQHEHIEYHHTDGQAKYLESVVNEMISNLLARLQDGIDLGG